MKRDVSDERFLEDYTGAVYMELRSDVYRAKAKRISPRIFMKAFPPEKPTKDFSWVEGVAVKLK